MTSTYFPTTFEQRLIQSIKEWVGGDYIGDDCAILPGLSLVTADTLVEGTHFLLEKTSLLDLGWKALAVNLSDIAAMAGRPRWAVVSLTIPSSLSTRKIKDLYCALVECAQTFHTEIVGGDLTAGPVLSLAITVIGESHELGCLRRSGAKPGDVVAVTGDFGASAAGLWVVQEGLSGFSYVKTKHWRPKPRLSDAWALIASTGERGALMDASDGLADALVQISQASGVGMEIELNLIPFHRQTEEVALRAQVSLDDWLLYGGEDYELVACLSKEAFQSLSSSSNCSFKAIGRVTDSKCVAVTKAGHPHLPLDLRKAFQHWERKNDY